jgi:hypothetical protein
MFDSRRLGACNDDCFCNGDDKNRDSEFFGGSTVDDEIDLDDEIKVDDLDENENE